MAKGYSNGVKRGKLGNTVLYKLSNSNNKVTQGERAYTGEVRNPKTLNQAIQRLKMAPAVNFYRAFKNEILDHSFEGVKYGGRSNSTFMKAALKLAAGYPFLEQGDTQLAPAAYQMSRGSLNGFETSFENRTNFICEPLSLYEVGCTFGEWSQSIIDSCPWVNDGDQITFAFILESSSNPYALVHRIVLDTTSTQSATSFMGVLDVTVDGTITVKVGNTAVGILGACIILSRPDVSQVSGAVTWQRSTSFMLVNNENANAAAFFTQSAYNAAVESYMAATGSKLNSTFYLNQGKAKIASQSIPAAPGTTVKLLCLQCRNENSKAYGKWLAAIIDPATGVTKVIGGDGNTATVQGERTTHVYYSYFGTTPDSSSSDFSKVTQYWDEQVDGGINEYLNVETEVDALETISWDDAASLCQEYGLTTEFDEVEEPAFPLQP